MFGHLIAYYVGKRARGLSRRDARILSREINDLHDPDVLEYREYQKKHGFTGEMYYLMTGRYLEE